MTIKKEHLDALTDNFRDLYERDPAAAKRLLLTLVFIGDIIADMRKTDERIDKTREDLEKWTAVK